METWTFRVIPCILCYLQTVNEKHAWETKKKNRSCKKRSKRDTKDCTNPETLRVLETGLRTRQHLDLHKRMSIFRETGILGWVLRGASTEWLRQDRVG